MTMFDAAEKIPKGVNIIIFIWAVIGLYMLIRNPKTRKDFYFRLYAAVIGFMVAWRIVIRILTSRYAAGLIIPFVLLASVFLVNSMKRRHLVVRLVIYVLLAVTGFIVLKMNLDSTTRNYYSDTIAEVFGKLGYSRPGDLGYSSPNDRTFVVEYDDFSRVYFQTRLGRNLGRIKEDDVRDYILGYTRLYPDTVLNAPSKSITDEIRQLGNMKPLVSLVEKKSSDKIKKQLVYAMTGPSVSCAAGRDECVPISRSRIAPCPENSLLDNGDMEALDSLEESSEKIKKHLGNVSQLSTADQAVRTPRGAYFTFAPADGTTFAPADELNLAPASGTVSGPEFNAQNDFAINGERSVRIHATDGTASMLFEKHFRPGGPYGFSMLVQGETGTNIRVFCDVCKADGGRESRTVATLLLPDKRLFQVTTYFSAADLADTDTFQVGVSVQNGGAFFDNFSLTPCPPAAQAAPDAD